jgi:hypothetical protein
MEENNNSHPIQMQLKKRRNCPAAPYLSAELDTEWLMLILPAEILFF